MEETMVYPFRWPRTAETPARLQSAAIAKRRLHDTLPLDRARVATSDEVLHEELCPQERRPT
jgi:hypothetical protein